MSCFMKKKQKVHKSINIKLFFIILLLLMIPLTAFAGSHLVTLFTKASVIPANIVVDAAESQASLERPWQGLSEGGEQEVPGELVSLAPVSGKIKALGTKYIRIDHVLEEPFANTLISRVKEITDSGATPIIALSYFPKDVADSQIGSPTNYAAWRERVKNLIETVSGKNNLNLSGVYYEVWNEPDGENFGSFSIGQGKDYFELYKQSVDAAAAAQNVNDFKIGGPALADLRRCENGLLFVCQTFWLDRFLNLVSQNNTRLDFVSWHRYSKNLDDYKEDVNFINDLYTKYGNLPQAEKVITEWGSVPQRSPLHATAFDAAHLVAAARTFIGHVDLATKFEIRDGPEPGGEGWGIVYYDGSEKPTYKALQLLSKLRPEKILISGEGSNVSGIASRDTSGVTLILVNYDPNSVNAELVPIKILNMFPGKYRLTRTTLDKEEISTTTLIKGTFTTKETMLPSSVVVYDLQLISLLTTSL